MRIRWNLSLILAGAALIVCYFEYSALGQGFRGVRPSEVIKSHENYAARFKAGDTNTPIFAMDWFESCRGDDESCSSLWCRVDKAGISKNWYLRFLGTAGGTVVLDSAKLHLLVETINQLPPPPKAWLPGVRQIIVSGIRSNQWFYGVYDRADIPKEVKNLWEIAGGFTYPSLDSLPKTQGKSVAPIK